MCELLGMSFDGPVSAEISVDTFTAADIDNADGWGMAWYAGKSLALVKEPLRWRQSSYAEFLLNYERARSPLFIAHVRHATVGGPPNRADSHPFARELFGREYCFAHNGTIRDALTHLPLGRFKPVGKTDSEHIFCHLLDQIAQRDSHMEGRSDFRWFYNVVSQINLHGKLNLMLSDGRHLFCYRDRVWSKGLNMRSMAVNQHKQRRLKDPTLKMNLSDPSHRQGIVVATRPLDDAPWRPLRQGELIVVRQGRLEFSSSRMQHANAAPTSDTATVK
jgi:glutamine amidotransferase